MLKAIKIRGGLLLASLAPSSILLFAGAPIARPAETLAWTVICATIAACAPKRVFKATVWAVVFSTPFTLIWAATVAVTGFPLGDSLLASVMTASAVEIKHSVSMALSSLSFLASASLVLGLSAWCIRLSWGISETGDKAFSAMFLIALLPFGVSQVDVAPGLRGIASQEARGYVPMLSLAAFSKDALSMLINSAASGQAAMFRVPVRRADAAAKTFNAAPGLVVFAVGESLRADALLKEGRGPWSDVMTKRIRAGLASRLPDACSYASATFGSVPRLLTGVDVGDENAANTSPTVLARAKAGGAATAFITGHEVSVVNELGHDWSTRTSSSEKPTYDDQAVLAMSDFSTKTTGRPAAIILHLYGQHFWYGDRYPPSAFDPEPTGLSSDALDELRYSRAAEYGMKILVDAAAALDARPDPAVLIFTSDHGENLPSDGTGKRYHALPSSGKNDTTVPVLAIWNKAFSESGRLLRIPMNLDSDSKPNWTRIPGQTGQSERSDAGFSVFTLLMS